MKRAMLIAIVSGLLLLASVPGALARGAHPPQPTDPKATSPAGTIYAIPLDTARSDAAPHRRTAPSGPASAGGPGTSGSSSGSGTSSSGPTPSGSGSGASPGSGASSATPSPGASGTPVTGSGTGSTPAATSDPGSLVHSENGFGSSSVVPGLRGAVPAAVELSAGGGGSPTGTLALIGVVILVAAYVGVVASRLSRR